MSNILQGLHIWLTMSDAHADSWVKITQSTQEILNTYMEVSKYLHVNIPAVRESLLTLLLGDQVVGVQYLGGTPLQVRIPSLHRIQCEKC